DAAGLLSAMTNAAGVRFTYQYDAVGQLIAVTDSKGNQQHFEYDEQRDLVRIFFTDPSGDLTFQQQYEYDGQSQLIRVQSLQAEEQLSYNVDGKPVQRQDALNAVEAFRYDGFNRLIKHIDKQGNATEFRYDNSDQLSRVTDAEGKATSYYYDNFNQLRQLISPDSGTSSFSYDAAGNRTSVTDARGIELQYQYDALNRLIRVQHSGGAEHIELRYDEQHGIHPAVGQLTSVTDSIGETQYQYTEHGQLALARHQLGANWYSLGYSYEHGERLKRVTLPSGSQVLYDYDSTGRIHKLSLQQLHGLQTLVSDIRYLPFGPIKSLHYGHGLTLHNEYDTDYKLVSRQLGSMLALGYQYDALNNITAIEQPLYGVSSEFGYDSLSRLISEFPAGRQFSYDSIGNRLRKEQAAGVTEYIYQPASHRLAERSGQHATLYQYDAAGNMVQRGAQQFEYNAFGRMAEVTTPERELSYR
ncbi:hypothetical protein ABC502_18585, partial [Alkalimonas sp. NCh-2]|uniref:hypothetical protein n=1 Tax=Alkalimonas sp. NCh-2 TaxID=3144846 RepID=UPI0031F64CD1